MKKVKKKNMKKYFNFIKIVFNIKIIYGFK